MWWPLDDPELLTEDAYIVTAAAGRALLHKAVKAGRRSGGEVQIMRSKRSGSVKAGNGRDGKARALSIKVSMNNRLMELLALFCFSLLSYQRVCSENGLSCHISI